MLTVLSIIILIVCGLLALVVLAQNPKGGGLAAGFTGAQQIGGVQRTADFLEKSTWTLATTLMVLCLVSAGVQGGGAVVLDDLDSPLEQVAPADFDPSQMEDAPDDMAD
jgi:preprotein translocase subunit SecG